MSSVDLKLFKPPYRLQGFVQHYDWGGYTLIPEFLGIVNEEKKPYAELWLGAHAAGPSRVILEEFHHNERKSPPRTIPLDALIAADPPRMLGPEVIQRFGLQLPFLMKILDARQMLSIQVHPSKTQAERGFADEESRGIALNVPQRNYKDTNHKPEAQVALTDLYMLHGFRPLEEIADVLISIPSFAALAPDFAIHLGGLPADDERRMELLQELYSHFMRLPQAEVDAAINPLLARIEPLFDRGELKKISPHYWAVQAARLFTRSGGHRDRGIFSIYLLNLLHLKPGQGTFQPAGLLHAYLQGANVEVMANSDNVLRGGLTRKHIDVEEVLKVVEYRYGPAAVLAAEWRSQGEKVYPTPVADFELSRIELPMGTIYKSATKHGPEILAVLQGHLTCNGKNCRRGDCLFMPANFYYSLQGLDDALLFKASVPVAT